MDSWFYEKFLDDIDYMPEENHFLDIWQYEGDTAPCVWEGVLHGKNLDQYLSEKRTLDVGPAPAFVGGLRLIYSHIGEDADCSDSTVCWSRSDFVKIMEGFRLPKRFTQMIGRCHSVFAQCPPGGSDGEAERFDYIFSTMFHHSPLLFLAGSWNPQTRVTSIFLHCAANPEREYMSRLIRFLTTNTGQAVHPMLLPLLIMDLETDSTLVDDAGWTSDMIQIEKQTKQRAGYTETVDPLDLDLASIVQQLNGCSSFVTLIERESEAVLLHLRQVREAISDLKIKSPAFDEVGRTLIRHVDFLTESRKNLFLRLQNLQRRNQIQLAFTYNLLAQRDNKLNIEVARDSRIIALASSRDSTAMKTVAILSIAFLPGTFVASLFAMPVFDWTASSEGGIVGKYFWMYWAFAIPLTALILGAWAVWVRLKLKQYEMEDERERTRSFFGHIAETNSVPRSDDA